MSGLPLFDAAGRRRSPATMPGYHAGREPPNKGRTYPADPPTVDEIVAVMRQAGEDRHGLRARALIVVLWRAALRIQEALSLTETDLVANRCSVLVQRLGRALGARSGSSPVSKRAVEDLSRGADHRRLAVHRGDRCHPLLV